MTFTASVQASLRVRIERWRRARELAADERAGSVGHRAVLGQRLAFLRRHGWRFAAGALILACPTAFLAFISDSPFVRGVCVGAYVVGMPMFIGSAVASATGTTFISMGADAERWTASVLRRAQRRGWRLVNDVTLKRGNIDHVLVGPGGAFAVETKWTSAPADTAYGREFWSQAVRQVEANTRSLGLWSELRKLGVQVRGVLVVWGLGSRDLPSDGHVLPDSGVVVVPGHALKSFVRQLPGDSLTVSQVELAWEALDHQVSVRDATDQRRRGSAGDLINRLFISASAAVLAILSLAVTLKLTSSPWTMALVPVTSACAAVLIRLRLFVPAAKGWIMGFLLLVPITLLYAFLG